ncbi:carbon-monoxide dehydrogenase large subunit [Amorphus suaedae]
MSVEDLLLGRGTFVADLAHAGALHAAFVRAPLAHARIRAIDTLDALGAPGVAAVLTAADLGEVAPLVSPVTVSGAGNRLATIGRPILCAETVRHVGDPVALVLAASEAEAIDAAELVSVDYDPLPGVASVTAVPASADRSGDAEIDPRAPGNVALDWASGPRGRTDAAFASAHRIVRITLDQARVAPTPLETRGALVAHDPATDRLTLELPTQGAAAVAGAIAASLGRDPASVRVITRDVGGSFGMKIYPYPEHVALAVAAIRTGRAVRWVASRAEALQSDTQGREMRSEAEMALDADGRFLAVRVRHQADFGAYVSTYAPHTMTYGPTSVATGLYAIPAADVAMTGRLSTTAWTDAYRGAGKPEGILVLEALVDAAARAMDLDPAEIRRRNLIGAAALPHATPAGETYDSGDFPARLEAALAELEASGASARRAAAARRGRLFGRGLSCWLDTTSSGPVDTARLTVDADGRARLAAGSQDTGQGHAAAFARIVGDRLGLALAGLDQGDSDTAPDGGGSYGAKTMAVMGSAVANACDALVAAAKGLAAERFQVAPADVRFERGDLAVPGTNHRIELAALARAAGGLGAEAQGGGATTYPNGCHACEVEIDPETGEVAVVAYVAADDYGTVLDRAGLAGQLLGGIAQGLGQAVHERVVFDAADAQLITGSLMDYGLPRAADMAAPTLLIAGDQPCRTTPLGTKGVGQAGAIAAPAAILNAINDALAGAGAGPITRLPATPLAVWGALSGERRRK